MKRFALLTYTNNETFFFPIWWKYYRHIFHTKDIYIINHNPDIKDIVQYKTANMANVIPLITEYNYPLRTILNFATELCTELLDKYDGVFIAESDEILHHPNHLLNAAEYYIENKFTSVRCLAYEPVHRYFEGEPDIDLSKSLLVQRGKWREASWMRKVVFISKSTIDWSWHMHDFDTHYPIADLMLTNIHLKLIDYNKLKNRNDLTCNKANFDPYTIEHNVGWQNRIEQDVIFNNIFKDAARDAISIPEKFKSII